MIHCLPMTTPNQENWHFLWLAQASNLCTKEKGYQRLPEGPATDVKLGFPLNLVFLVMPMQQRIFKGKCSSGSRRGRFSCVLWC
jgi:hypothetical protein